MGSRNVSHYLVFEMGSNRNEKCFAFLIMNNWILFHRIHCMEQFAVITFTTLCVYICCCCYCSYLDVLFNTLNFKFIQYFICFRLNLKRWFSMYNYIEFQIVAPKSCPCHPNPNMYTKIKTYKNNHFII